MVLPKIHGSLDSEILKLTHIYFFSVCDAYIHTRKKIFFTRSHTQNFPKTVYFGFRRFITIHTTISRKLDLVTIAKLAPSGSKKNQ